MSVSQTLLSAARKPFAAYDPLAHKAIFICRDCFPRAVFPGPVVRQTRRYASNRNAPFTERLRRKIWKDEPPGPENVYGESQLFPSKRSQKPAPRKADDESDLDSGMSADHDIREGLTAERAKELDPSYEPASTWKQLDQVGGTKGWWEHAWDKENRFTAFRSTKDPSALSKERLFRLIRRAYVEAHVLQSEGLDLNSISELPMIDYLPFHTAELMSTEQANLSVSVPSSWHEHINKLIKDEEVVAYESGHVSQSSLEETASAEQVRLQWYNLPLTDLALKFAVVKRLTQLAGARVSDADLTSISSLGQLARCMEHKEPPKKAAQRLNEVPGLKQLPNVHIYAERQTWVDREKRLGRYKIITEKLQQRGLPIPRRRRR